MRLSRWGARATAVVGRQYRQGPPTRRRRVPTIVVSAVERASFERLEAQGESDGFVERPDREVMARFGYLP